MDLHSTRDENRDRNKKVFTMINFMHCYMCTIEI